MGFSGPRLKGLLILAALLALGVCGTLFIDARGLDMVWAGAFFDDAGPGAGWTQARSPLWQALYRYGTIPTWILTCAALLGLVATWMGKLPDKFKKPCLVVILTVALGPGLVVNGVLKGAWGRPRPADVSVFYGQDQFRKVWEPGGIGAGKSFTCGHCSMGFAIASGVAFYPIFPGLAAVALLLGIEYGVLMGIARIAQGGHFPTDVLWSGIIVLSLISILYYFVFQLGGRSADGADSQL